MTASPLTSSMKWLIPFSERAKALKAQLNAVFLAGSFGGGFFEGG